MIQTGDTASVRLPVPETTGRLSNKHSKQARRFRNKSAVAFTFKASRIQTTPQLPSFGTKSYAGAAIISAGRGGRFCARYVSSMGPCRSLAKSDGRHLSATRLNCSFKRESPERLRGTITRFVKERQAQLPEWRSSSS